jgi:hypothetical protein
VREEERLAEVAGGGGVAGGGRRSRGLVRVAVGAGAGGGGRAVEERDAEEGEESAAAADAGDRAEEGTKSVEQMMQEMETDQMDKVWRDLEWGDGLDCLPLGPFYLSKPAFSCLFFLLEDNICILVYIQNALKRLGQPRRLAIGRRLEVA